MNKIPVSPKDSIVGKVVVNEELANQIGDTYIGETVYVVTFNHTEDNNNGKLVVYISKNKGTVIGKGYEERE